MSDPFRDENEANRARLQQVEDELAEAQESLARANAAGAGAQGTEVERLRTDNASLRADLETLRVANEQLRRMLASAERAHARAAGQPEGRYLSSLGLKFGVRFGLIVLLVGALELIRVGCAALH